MFFIAFLINAKVTYVASRKEKIIIVESTWNENFQRFPSEKIG